jgi:hypothetical protein
MNKPFVITAMMFFFTLHLSYGQQNKKTESQRDLKLKYSSPGNISSKDYSAADHTLVIKNNNSVKTAKAQTKKTKLEYRSNKLNRKHKTISSTTNSSTTK